MRHIIIILLFVCNLVDGQNLDFVTAAKYNDYGKVYDIWIVAGQSNTDGRVPIMDTNCPIYLKDGIVDGVKVWNGSGLVDYDLSKTGPSNSGASFITTDASKNMYSFAHVALYRLARSKNILVCQVSEGGTQIAIRANTRGCWNTSYSSIPEGTPKLLQELENRYAAMITYLNANNFKYRIKGVMWHQGESEVEASQDLSATYFLNFTNVISKIRSFTGVSNLLVIFGTIPFLSLDYNLTIQQSQFQIASLNSYYPCFCIDNYHKTILDNYHFDAISANEFGYDVFRIASMY